MDEPSTSPSDLRAELSALAAENVRLASEKEQLQREVKTLIDELAVIKNMIFGKKTERLDPNQLSLFTTDEVVTEDVATEETVAVPAHKRRKKGHGRERFPDHLERKDFICDVPSEDRVCADCGEEMRDIGEDVTERGHFVPATFIVHRYKKKKYACPKGHRVKCGEAPAALIDRCKYEPSVYAHVATSKYCDHVPLHRMAGIFKRHGVNLPKSTMWDMLVRVNELVAEPVLRQMRDELRRSEILYADETPVTCRLEDEKGTRKSYVWAWRTPDDHVVMDFTMTRERDGPSRFLGSWGGTAVMDAYSGFDEVVRNNGIIRAGCWAHARRKLKEAIDTGSKPAARVMAPVQRLFWIERAMKRRAAARGLSRDELWVMRFDVRRRLSRRVVKKIYGLLDELFAERSTLPRSLLGKALTYLDRQRDPLRRFLADGRIEMHNNDTERTLRHLAIGRNNWRVFGSPKGGGVAANLYSLVLSCRAMGIDVEKYLLDVLSRIDSTPASEIATLTPWAWAAAHDQPLTLAHE